MTDYKARVKNAMMEYQAKIDKDLKRERDALSGVKKKKTKNEKPEKVTEAEVIQWLSDRKFNFNVVEAKAVYSVSAGRYLSGQTDPGFSDIVANDSSGRAFFIELKAKGKKSTLKSHQYIFLKEKIEMNCFACVCDSAEMLDKIYLKWGSFLARGEHEMAMDYLLEQLYVPKEIREMDSEPLFS